MIFQKTETQNDRPNSAEAKTAFSDLIKEVNEALTGETPPADKALLWEKAMTELDATTILPEHEVRHALQAFRDPQVNAPEAVDRFEQDLADHGEQQSNASRATYQLERDLFDVGLKTFVLNGTRFIDDMPRHVAVGFGFVAPTPKRERLFVGDGDEAWDYLELTVQDATGFVYSGHMQNWRSLFTTPEGSTLKHGTYWSKDFTLVSDAVDVWKRADELMGEVVDAYDAIAFHAERGEKGLALQHARYQDAVRAARDLAASHPYVVDLYDNEDLWGHLDWQADPRGAAVK